jgi:hypothetical protein
MLCQGLHIDAINQAFLPKGEEAATPAELCRLAARPRFVMGTGNGCATQGDDNVRIRGLPVTDGWIYPRATQAVEMSAAFLFVTALRAGASRFFRQVFSNRWLYIS